MKITGETKLVEIADWLGIPEREVRVSLATELYRERRISLGLARRLSGLDISEFIKELGKRKITIHYTLEDVEMDTASIKKYTPQTVR